MQFDIEIYQSTNIKHREIFIQSSFEHRKNTSNLLRKYEFSRTRFNVLVNGMKILEDWSFDVPLLEIQRFRGQGTQKHIPDQCNIQMIQQERGEVTWLKPIDRIASLSSPLIHRSFRNLGIRGTVWSCVNVRPTGEPVKLALRGIRQINFDQVERHRTRAPIILLGGLNRLLFKTFLFLNIFSRYTATKLNGLLLEVNLWNGH